ncbi:TMEM175 family protein [Gemmatimonas sp.]|jgi:uncharacterized membrane protein|uniref:TMEM175 family protein n=1 Tax=Gemmatimonas sp. TaxID=1962908 RepID=UPI0022C8DE4C|nr:TMEM175 family protein [Gemmatimonas sp.]MCZ8205831.1 TMEM175 family protein [Gemmatimonas sp.]
MTTPRSTYPTERLGALSDGVFSIVLTLLVLDLKMPDVARGADQSRMLIADLESQIPNLIAWLISVVLVARFWIAHHAIVASLARCHVGTMVRNFVVLALVSLVPFAASLIGRYEFESVAVLVFAALMGMTGLSLGFFAHHARTAHELRRQLPLGDLNWHWSYHARILPTFSACTMLLLTVDEVAAVAVWGLEPLLAMGVARRMRGREATTSDLLSEERSE